MSVLTKALGKALAAVCVVLFALLVVVVVWQVFTRQVLNSPAAWTEELSRYVFVWVGLFAAALVFAERGHIAVDFLARKAPRSAQRVIGILVQVAILAFALLVFCYGGWRVIGGAWNQSLSALPVTLGQMYLVLPITGVLIAIFTIENILELLGGADPFPEEVDEAAAGYLDDTGDAADEGEDVRPGTGATAARPEPGTDADPTTDRTDRRS